MKKRTKIVIATVIASAAASAQAEAKHKLVVSPYQGYSYRGSWYDGSYYYGAPLPARTYWGKGSTGYHRRGY